ncbi:MAG: hypothetical protein ABI761_09415 [Saprospiraceae bacterium]
MEEDKLKQFIQTIGVDEPSAEFTDNLMKLIESQKELSLHPTLLSALKKELLVEPSSEFQNRLMASIHPKTNILLKPIITKKIWLVISGIAALLLILAMLSSKSGANYLHTNSYFSNSGLNIASTTEGIIKISTSFFLYLIPLSILLLLDYVFRTRRTRLS